MRSNCNDVQLGRGDVRLEVCLCSAEQQDGEVFAEESSEPLGGQTAESEGETMDPSSGGQSNRRAPFCPGNPDSE
jgi:hypothetical protein